MSDQGTKGWYLIISLETEPPRRPHCPARQRLLLQLGGYMETLAQTCRPLQPLSATELAWEVWGVKGEVLAGVLPVRVW